MRASWTMRYADRSTPGGRSLWVAVDVDLDRYAGLPDVRDQPVEVGQRGLRGVVVGGQAFGLGVAEHRQQPAHVAQSRGVGLLDRVEGPARSRGVGVEGRAGSAGLEDGDGDGVGDDVVQLAGDPGPLLGDRAGGPLLLLAAEALVLGVQLGLALAPQPQGQPGGPGSAGEDQDEGDITEVGLREPAFAVDEDRHRQDQPAHTQPRLDPGGVPAQGVERHEERDNEGHRVVVEAGLELGEQLDSAHHQQEGDERGLAPEREGQGRQQAGPDGGQPARRPPTRAARGSSTARGPRRAPGRRTSAARCAGAWDDGRTVSRST